jgi:hypothetical protein
MHAKHENNIKHFLQFVLLYSHPLAFVQNEKKYFIQNIEEKYK